MIRTWFRKFKEKITLWITYEPPQPDHLLPFDYSRLKHEIRRGDVLLIEGRSRISNVIRYITQSSWTHAALYIGRPIDIENVEIKRIVSENTKYKENTPLIFEDLLDEGTVVRPLSHYKNHHIRICRPIGITIEDINRVSYFCLSSLGQPYNVRHLFDLFRFLLPWGILPRRWGSSLFTTSDGKVESSICSSRLAQAFASVRFPILPFVRLEESKDIEFIQRNPHLFTPKDFDTSPYFEIIKYPIFNPKHPLPYYRHLPWNKEDLRYDDHGILTEKPVGEKLATKNKKNESEE